MNNWRLLLFAFLAVFQPIASFTEHCLVDGRCSERDSNLLSSSRLAIYGSRLTKPADERRDTRNDIRSESSILARLSTDKRDSADNRARDLSRYSRISADRAQQLAHNFRGERLFDSERTDRRRDSRVNTVRDSREERFSENQRDRSARYVRDNRDSELRERRDTKLERNSANRDLGYKRSTMLNVRSNRRTVDVSQVRAADRQISSRRERENVMRAETDNERRERRVSRTESERRTVLAHFRDENARDRNIVDRRAREVEGRRTTSLNRIRGAQELRSSAYNQAAERDERRLELRSSSRFNRVSEKRITGEESIERVREIRDDRVRMQRDNSQERRVRDARILNLQTRSESRDRRLESHDRQLESHDRQLESRNRQHESRNRQLESRNRRFESHDQQLESRDRQLESRDRRLESRVRQHESRDRQLESRVRQHESRDRRFESRLAEREIRQSRQDREMVRESGIVGKNRNDVRDVTFIVRREKREVSRDQNTQNNIFRNRELSNDRIRSESVLTRDYSYGKPTEQKETFNMTWHYLLYALQGAYMCHILIQMTGHKRENPQKSRSFSWWFPAQSLKVD